MVNIVRINFTSPLNLFSVVNPFECSHFGRQGRGMHASPRDARRSRGQRRASSVSKASSTFSTTADKVSRRHPNPVRNDTRFDAGTSAHFQPSAGQYSPKSQRTNSCEHSRPASSFANFTVWAHLGRNSRCRDTAPTGRQSQYQVSDCVVRGANGTEESIVVTAVCTSLKWWWYKLR